MKILRFLFLISNFVALSSCYSFKGKSDMERITKMLEECKEEKITRIDDRTSVVKCNNDKSFSITKGLR